MPDGADLLQPTQLDFTAERPTSESARGEEGESEREGGSKSTIQKDPVPGGLAETEGESERNDKCQQRWRREQRTNIR